MKSPVSSVFAAAAARAFAGVLASLVLVAPVLADSSSADSSQKKTAASTTQHPSSTKKPSSASSDTSHSAHTAAAHKKNTSSRRRKRRTSPEALRIKRAFVASTELRPMAQQLANLRTPAAYTGVTNYAHQHTGDAAGAAYLALGHAYLLDRRFGDAATSLHQARQASDALADYADFLGARAQHEAGNESGAEALLHGFAGRYPDSVFVVEAPELEGTVLLAMNDLAGAQRVLDAAAHTASADRPGYQLARAQLAQARSETAQANIIFKQVLLEHPLSPEAEKARAQLTATGADATLTAAELRSLGNAYYNAGRYSLAAEQYNSLARLPGLSDTERQSFAVEAAACDLKLKRLTPSQVQALPDTSDNVGAQRSYLLMELARNRGDEATQQSIVADMEQRFPHSEWLAEALFSSGNMYLLSRNYPKAIEYYSYLAAHFPQNKNASAAHWRAGWLSYRQGLYSDAARIFDEQISLFPALPKRWAPSTGGAESTRRRSTNLRRPLRSIERSFALTSISSTRKWRGSVLLRWAHCSRLTDPEMDRAQGADSSSARRQFSR